VNEQIEEEANVTKIIDKLTLSGENNLYLFDRDIVAMRAASAQAGAKAGA
jgi:ferritin